MKSKKKPKVSHKSILFNEVRLDLERLRIDARNKAKQAEDAMQVVLDYALGMEIEIQRLRKALKNISDVVDESLLLDEDLAQAWGTLRVEVINARRALENG